jgi:hypothetical protein
VKALDDQGAFRRHGLGPDASMLLVTNRLLPASGMHHMSRIVLGIPRFGSMRNGAWPLTTAQRAMVSAAKVIPQPVLTKLVSLASRLSPAKSASEESTSR